MPTRSIALVKALSVRYYVSGSYQRVGEDVRVVSRLVDADAGTIVVQESLTDRFANLLALQDDLARRFAGALDQSSALGLKQLLAGDRVPTAHIIAGGVSVRRRSQRPLSGWPLPRCHRAAAEFASGRTTRYAEAWALLGKSYARLAPVGTLDSEGRAGVPSQALTASLRAAEINPALYEAQVSLALAYRALEQIRTRPPGCPTRHRPEPAPRRRL